MDSTEDIARAVAEQLGGGLDHPWASWQNCHPVVKATVEWLDEKNYLDIVEDVMTCNYRWNAPYLEYDGHTAHTTVACVLPKGHDGNHRSAAKVASKPRADDGTS